ncbi:SDR family NAD(P)-dependent oxidoreductase [Streptomyces sp. NPDC057798]|uniref:SDR family NAD(P)-dependent oxidoreductase n=1 Tax=Streptomyces sp. NPDC057798 TaxID=3346252 RepID=UPI0036CB77AB
MDINGARVLVAGATGALGAALTAEPVRQGARPAIAGRDRSRLSRISGAHPGVPTVLFDAYDPASCARAADVAVGELGGLDAVVTAFGTVAERPQPGMADYSASKAALGAWLDAVRREARGSGIRVLDNRPGHLNTGFADRAVTGTAPPMPPGGDPDRLVGAVVTAPATDAERVRTAPDGEPVVERRAR